MDNTGNKYAIISVSESVYDYKSKMNGDNDGIKKVKVKKGFYCDVCEYSTIRKNNMDKHLVSKKHKEEILRMGNDGKGKGNGNGNGYEMFKCKCGSSYTHVSSLSRHKRTCSASIEDENNKKIQENPNRYGEAISWHELVDNDFLTDYEQIQLRRHGEICDPTPCMFN